MGGQGQRDTVAGFAQNTVTPAVGVLEHDLCLVLPIKTPESLATQMLSRPSMWPGRTRRGSVARWVSSVGAWASVSCRERW